MSVSWPAPSTFAAGGAILAAAVWLLCFRLLPRRQPVKEEKAQLPPGSFGWPVVGETLDFVSCAYSPRPEAFVEKRRLRYGSAVFRSHLFGSSTVVTADAEVSRSVLQSDARSFVPWYPRSLTELMGKSSILLINGSLQRRVHGLVGAFFKSPQLKAQITADMQRRLAPALAAWRAQGPGARLRIQDHAKTMVFQILVRGLIGLEAGPEMQQLKQEFQEFIVGLMSLPIKLPGTRLYRSLQAKKRMARTIQRIIQEKRRRGVVLCGPPRDAIDVLMADGSDELTDELISDNMIDLMIPAEDSVPVLITLAVKFLSECPLALQRLEEENMQLKMRKTDVGETLQWTDYMSLSFTQHVITETLRLGNIISGIMRKAVRDVEVKGHLIPKGWCVFVYFRSVHLDDTLYEDPSKFNPWRWKEEDMSTSSFTPFGGGQRLCPGLDLARLEASIFLHHLVTSFRSNEPLGKPVVVEGEGISAATSINVDFDSAGIGATTPATTPSPTATNNKRKRASNMSEEDAIQYSNMSDALRDVAGAINNTCHTETHPDLYNAVMDLPFEMDQRLAVLDYLTENKGKGLNFLKMKVLVREASFKRILAKNPDLL